MRRNLLLLLLSTSISFLPLKAEDWTTTDGKTYQDVKVVKVDADLVTIIHRDGGAAVPLATLSHDLQVRYKYDPAKASAAATARTRADSDSVKALQAEKDKENARKLAEAQVMAKAAAQSQTNSAANGLKPIPPKDDHLQTQGGKDGPRDVEHSDSRTHYTGM